MRKIKNKKYHYFYKITNLINNHFYYGIHSTDNLEDGYMGSGTRLHKAYEKYGIENFEKEILKFFDSREECAEYEMEMVTEELVHDYNCYNISVGGDKFNTLYTSLVKDNNGHCFRVTATEKEKLNLDHPSKNMVSCYIVNTCEHCMVSCEEFNKHRDLYFTASEGRVTVKDLSGNLITISCDEYKQNKDIYLHHSKNKHLMKDLNNNYFFTSLNDSRYLNGELISFWKNRNHSDETIKKIKNTMRNNNHQQGEKNSRYGTCWVHNDVESLSVNKSELQYYLSNGYQIGRFIKNKENIAKKNKNKIWVNKDGKTSFVYKDVLKTYIENGWLYGRVPKITKRTLNSEGYKFYNELYKTVFNKEYEITK